MHVRIFHDIIATCLNIVSDGAVHWSWGGSIHVHGVGACVGWGVSVWGWGVRMWGG